MRKRWNKVCLAAAALIVAGAVCAAFGGGKAEGPAAGGLPQVELKMMIPGPPQKDQGLVNDALTKYLKDTLNVKLNIQQFDYGSWNDRSNLIVASGEPCDVMFSAAWTGFNTDAVKGAFVQLDDLLPKYGQDILKANYAWILDAGRINGKLYGIATYQELAQQRGFFLRKDLVDKYHFVVKPLNDVEDLEAMLKVIKENEPGMLPLFMEPGHLLSEMGPWDRQGRYETTAVDVYSGKPEYVNFYDNDFYRKSMALARKWFLAGYVNKDAATTQTMTFDMMKAGNTFACDAITNAGLQDSKWSTSWGVPIISFNTIKPIISTSLIQGALFAIPRQSKNPERAMMFINRMHFDKQLDNMIVYGIEGVHYVKKSDNVIGPPPGVQASSGLYNNVYWMMGNETLLYTYEDQDPRTPQLVDQFNQNAVRTPALGFTYDPSKMKSEIAALTNVSAQYDPGLSSGTVDGYADGLYNQFLDKLKAAGIDKLLADQNAQLSAWMKVNKK